MRKKTCLTFLFALFGLSIWHFPSARCQEIPIQASMLWKIEHDSLPGASYLFGTIHVIPSAQFFVPELLNKLADSLDQLVLEIPIDMGATAEMTKGMMMVAPPTMRELLGEENFGTVSKFLRDSMPMLSPNFQLIQPIFLAEQIALGHCFANETASYELYFDQLYRKKEKNIRALETIDEQLKSLSKVPLKEQAAHLIRTIETMKHACGEYERLFEMYLDQDLEEIMFFMQNEPGMGEHLEALLYDRNEIWVERISKLIPKNRSFIAVGAAHLGGEKGLISLLEEAGFSLMPVPISLR